MVRSSVRDAYVCLPYIFTPTLIPIGALETFIVGAALSTTSIGTTFVVISSSAKIDFTNTKVGTVLVSAALFDDISGLIMVSVIQSLGELDGGDVNLGWLIGRPIVASFAIGIVAPLLARYATGPVYRRWLEHRIAGFGHRANIWVMIVVLCAFLAVASYAGASLLFGAFLAGTFLSALPSKENGSKSTSGTSERMRTPSYKETFGKYVSGAQTFVLEPLFFASIGFAIPFKSLWTGAIVWRGIVFTLLMAAGKASPRIFIGVSELLD